MSSKKNRIDRRDFLKTVGAAGVGSMFAAAGSQAWAKDPNAVDPNAAEAKKPEEPHIPMHHSARPA